MNKDDANITAKLDWLQIIFYRCSIDELLETFLGIEKSYFMMEEASIQHKDYDVCYSYGSMRIYTYEFPQQDEKECYLIFSGDACTLYEQQLESIGSSWKQFFYKLCTRFEQRFKVKRLDLALDDRNAIPYFTVEQLIKKCKQLRYESRKRKFEVRESKYQGTKTGKTLYIGQRTSEIMFRIYDKDIETAIKNNCSLEEIGSWKRLEIELKRDIAHSMVEIIAHEDQLLENLIRGLVKRELIFYVDAEWTRIPRFWARYLGKVETLEINRIYEVRGLKDTEHWLQYGGGLSAIKAFDFLARNNALGHLHNLLHELEETELSTTLAKKLVDHLIDIGRKELVKEVYTITKKAPIKENRDSVPQSIA